MERPEQVFDLLQGPLNLNDFASWSRTEVNLLLSILSAYYEGMQQHRDCDHGGDADRRRTSEVCVGEGGDFVDKEAILEVDRALSKVRNFLQKKIPFGSIAEPTTIPSEGTTTTVDHIARPAERKRAASHVYAIDAFLYMEEQLEELVDQGKVAREYCRKCGSTDIGLTDFITHSFSQDQLVYISCMLLPTLSQLGIDSASGYSCRTVVDVGSRLGVVLWACYFSAQQGLLQATERVMGVELDSVFVKVQEEVLRRMCSRPVELRSEGETESHYLQVGVLEGNCFTGEGAETLRSADVVILHNVFEYFSSTSTEHLRCWLQLRQLVERSGQLLICSPSLEETFSAFGVAVLEEAGLCPPFSSSATTRGKRRREEPAETPSAQANTEESTHAAILNWIDSYVERVDVGHIAKRFVVLRSMALGLDENGTHSRHNCCTANTGEKEMDASRETSEADYDMGAMSELEEAIRNIHVYRVK